MNDGDGAQARLAGALGSLPGLAAVGLVLVIAATWPAVTVLDSTALTDLVEPDLQAGLWWPSSFAEAVVHGRNPFRPTELIWPAGQDIRLIGVAFGWIVQLVFLPVHLVTGPVVGMNVVTVLTMWLNGLCCAWAGWAATGSVAGALAGLAVGSTSAYAFSEGGYGRPEQALWAPVAVYFGALVRLQEHPGDTRTRVIGALSLGAAGLFYPFYGYFLVVTTALVVLGLLLLRRATLRGVVDLVWVGAGSAVLLVVVLSPVLWQLARDASVFTTIAAGGGDHLRTQMHASLPPSGYLGPFSWGRTYVAARCPILLFPLSAWAALRGPRGVRLVAWMGMLAAVFAAGPVLVGDGGDALRLGGGPRYLPAYLLDYLPGFKRMWWPYRWLGLATPALAVVAAWVAAKVPWPRPAVVVFCAWCVGECFFTVRTGVAPGEGLFRTLEVPAVFARLAESPSPTPILQVPDGRLLNGMVGWQAFHKQPINSGLCWHMPGMRPGPGSEKTPFARALTAAMGGASSSPRQWTPTETGGFHHVLYRRDVAGAGQQEEAGIRRLLGAPFYEDRQLAIWAIPGVGTPPAGG